jgi:hypothetical protein
MKGLRASRISHVNIEVMKSWTLRKSVLLENFEEKKTLIIPAALSL